MLDKMLGYDPISQLHKAVVAEWLRRLTRNQIPSGSVGSNPTDCEMHYHFFGLSKKSSLTLTKEYIELNILPIPDSLILSARKC